MRRLPTENEPRFRQWNSRAEAGHTLHVWQHRYHRRTPARPSMKPTKAQNPTNNNWPQNTPLAMVQTVTGGGAWRKSKGSLFIGSLPSDSWQSTQSPRFSVRPAQPRRRAHCATYSRRGIVATGSRPPRRNQATADGRRCTMRRRRPLVAAASIRTVPRSRSMADPVKAHDLVRPEFSSVTGGRRVKAGDSSGGYP